MVAVIQLMVKFNNILQSNGLHLSQTAIDRIQRAPWDPHVRRALDATAQLREIVQPFAKDYASEHSRDTLPSWWTKE